MHKALLAACGRKLDGSSRESLSLGPRNHFRHGEVLRCTVCDGEFGLVLYGSFCKLHFTRGIRAAVASLEPSGGTTGPTCQAIGRRKRSNGRDFYSSACPDLARGSLKAL